jgi:sulfopropanediol 3-dehydrogenase
MEHIKKSLGSPAEDRKLLAERVASILDKVREQGDEALREFSRQFDRVELERLRVDQKEIKAAADRLPGDLRKGLEQVVEHVSAFAQAQRECLLDLEREMFPGFHLGHRFIPVCSVGAYVPGGRYPTMSAPMMTIVPAKVAGVSRVAAVSPPSYEGRIHPAILFGMSASGADEIYALGGAQAIAALAYGTESIKSVDMIVGPGNQYVAEAKRQIFGIVGIDLIAGPSEVMVIADGSAKPNWVAADILAQCEHDTQARGALVTNSRALAEEVLKEIEKQLSRLATEKVARRSWEDHGEIILVDSLQEAARAADEWAPEHLEVHTRDPKKMLPMLHNYGSLFLGEEAAEVFADKLVGTNHILPTLGGARHTGGLWVGKFLKCITHQWCTKKAMEELIPIISQQSRSEGMIGHAISAEIRSGKKSYD